MKKKIFLSVVVLIIFSTFWVIKSNGSVNTVEEAISKFASRRIDIIHEEKTNKGSMVFYNEFGGDSLSTAFVRKSIFGYKTAYSGVHGDIKFAANRLGSTYSYYPAIEKTSLPIYFGVIGNQDISQIKVVEKKRNIEGQAKIIEAKGMRIWIVYMSEFQGSEFEIIGLSKEGKEVLKIADNISPYYADQKPFKGYK